MLVKILRQTTGMILHNGAASIMPSLPGLSARVRIHAGGYSISLDGDAVRAIAEACKKTQDPALF